MAKSSNKSRGLKANKTFLSIMIGIIILLLLFSVIGVAVLYINNPTAGGVQVQQVPVNLEDLNFEPIVETTPVVEDGTEGTEGTEVESEELIVDPEPVVE